MRKVAFSLLAASSLAAQDPVLPDLQQALDQPIAAASKRLQRLKEAPADATVITAVELRELGYRTLGEALEGVLGFRLNRDRAYDGLGVRGLYMLGDQNTRVLIQLDGHTLNSPAEVGSGKLGEDFGISMDQVERLEIIRGPASSLHGNNAFLGMVNVVVKDMAGSEVTATASDRKLGELSAIAGGRLGETHWQVLASNLKRDGSKTDFQAPGFLPLPADLDQEERQSAYLTAKGSLWSVAGYAMSRTQGMASAPFLADIGSPLNRYRNRLLFGEARFEPTLGSVETLFRLFGDRNEYSNVLAFEQGRTASLSGLYSESDPDRSLGTELQARVHARPDLLLTLGTEYSWHRFNGRAGVAPNLLETRVRHEVSCNYAQADWTPTESLTFVAGLQVSSWKVGSAESFSGGAITELEHRTLSGVTPRFACIWLPTSVDIVKVLYGGGYRNPTVFERFYDDGSSVRANPGLEPERIETLEGIWVRVWGGGLQSQLSCTESRWRNLVQTVDLGNGYQQSRNEDGTIRGHALEGELKGRWPNWELYTQAGVYRWERAGVSLPDVAAFQAAGRLTRRWGPWSASTEVRYLGPRRNDAVGAEVPGATNLRLALRWEGAHLWVRATAEDLGESGRSDLVAQEYLPITVMPTDGRTFLLTAGYRF